MAGTSFHTLTPCRIVDTRNPAGPLGGPSLTGGASRTFVVINQCSLPATATAIAVNVAETGAQGSGHLKVYPGGTSAPNASTHQLLRGTDAGEQRDRSARGFRRHLRVRGDRVGTARGLHPGHRWLFRALTMPLVATINFAAGEPAIANGAIVPLTTNPTANISVYLGTGAGTHADLVLDVTGYFQ